MAQFLDEILPAYVNYGASFKQSHAVQIHGTQNGDEFRRLLHPLVRLDYQFTYEQDKTLILEEVIDFYQKTNGSFRSFRVKDFSDNTTNNFVDTPTAQDMLCVPCTVAGVEIDPVSTPFSYAKLIRWYGDPTDPYCARRYLKKPIQGTVRVSTYTSIDGYIELTEKATSGDMVSDSDFTVDYTTGIIETYKEFSDSGETKLYAGCEFHIPCRFEGTPSFALQNWSSIQGSAFAIKEVFNP